MKLSYYVFDENSNKDAMFLHCEFDTNIKLYDSFLKCSYNFSGDCDSFLKWVCNKSYEEIDSMTDEEKIKFYHKYQNHITFINKPINGSITWVKNMIKEFGDLFEVTPIKVKGNNSIHKYNQHL